MTDARDLAARYLSQRRDLTGSEFRLSRATLEELGVGNSGPVATSPTPGSAATLEEAPSGPFDRLALEANGCTKCHLCETRNSVVFGEGNRNADLVVVGEAPGADEDKTGRPFVGRAGKLLDVLLLSIGLPRSEVYICNVLKCRPPKNRNPTPDEVETCSPYLRQQLELISPKAVLAVGTFPAQTLLNTGQSIGKLRGGVHEYEGRPLVPTYHPAALLRNPGWVRPVWEDLQRLRDILDR